MSRYAFFMCSDCKTGIWLGKPILKDENYQQVNYFHIGQRDEPMNWERRTLNQAIWKMLADHAGHGMHVVIEDGPLDYDNIFDDFTEIGGDEIKDISFEEFLGDWDGL